MAVTVSNRTNTGSNPVRLREIVDPSPIPDVGHVYTNDIAGVTELMYLDSDGNEVQLTGGGAVAGAHWDLTSGVIHPSDTLNNLTIGSSSNVAKMGVIGDTDEVQAVIRAHSTQTADLIKIQRATGADRISFDADANIIFETAGANAGFYQDSTQPNRFHIIGNNQRIFEFRDGITSVRAGSTGALPRLVLDPVNEEIALSFGSGLSQAGFSITYNSFTTSTAGEYRAVHFATDDEVQWVALGQVPATQRNFRIDAPRYDCSVAGATITDAATFAIAGPPTAGSANMTLTNAHALWVQAGNTQLDGDLTHTGTNVGLYGAAAVAQHSTTGQTAGFTAGAGTSVLDDSTFTGGVGATAYTIGDVVRALKNIGAMAQ